MDSKTFTVYRSHFNLQEIKEPKFIVANIILVKVATQHQSLSGHCLQDGFRSIFVSGKQNIKIFSNLKLHNAPINVNPMGGGECGQGVGI